MHRPPDSGNKREGLDYASFVEAFPFFLAWDEDFTVVDCGPSLVKICQDVRIGSAFSDFFLMERPIGKLDHESLQVQRGSLFLFRHVESSRLFRAQLMLSGQDERCGMFLASPWFTKPELVEIVAGSVNLSPREQRRVANFTIRVRLVRASEADKAQADVAVAAAVKP